MHQMMQWFAFALCGVGNESWWSRGRARCEGRGSGRDCRTMENRSSACADRLLVAGLEKRQSKTFRFVQRLGYGKSEIYAAIVGLTVEDYSLGPLPDEKGRPHDLWVFGTYLEQYETYVKLVAFVSREGVEVVCVSFHEAERPLFYPYRKAS